MQIHAIIAIVYSVFLMVLIKEGVKGFNPAVFFTFFWALQICFILFGWSNYLYFNYFGIFYILLAVTIFDLGFILIPNRRTESDRQIIKVYYSRKYSKVIFFSILILAVIGVFYNMVRNGFGLSSLFSLESFVQMSNENSINRYSGDGASRTVLNYVFDINGYACPLVGGLFYHYYQGKKRLWSLVSFFPSVFDGLIQGAKMGIITGVIMWGIGYILSCQLFGIKIKIGIKHVLGLAIGLFAFVVILFLSMMFRYGGVNEDTFYVVTGKITSYSLGHLPAFDIWLDGYHGDITEYTFGARTFNGITNPLGILNRAGGIFEEPVAISPLGDSTNVYSMFRFFVEDFGIVGSLMYLFVMGCLCGIINHFFLRRKQVLLCATLLTMMYFFISWGFVSSIFAYATYIALGFYIFFIFLFFFKLRRRRFIIRDERV